MKKMKITTGAVITEPGSTLKEKTGAWRTIMPVIDRNKCDGYGDCWAFCPDNAISIRNKKAFVNYDYCKGCGICAQVCPVKAIRMVKDEK